MTRQFTGRHMAMILVGFFGIIIAVNMLMASFAVRNFGGTVVDNSYVASQKFNDWIAASREQAEAGWQLDARLDEDGHVLLRTDREGIDAVSARAEHPTRKGLDVALDMERTPDGLFRSTEPLPAGRWQVRSVIASNGNEARFLHTVHAR